MGAAYYAAMAAYLAAHPQIFFTFQPGTFQMAMGADALAPIYQRADLFIVNKAEAGRILGLTDAPHDALLTGLHALGPRRVIITDDRKDTYISDGERVYTLPMYPDIRPPFERTGAGDAFASTITAAMTLGIPFADALLWGPVNSMSVVQQVGAQAGLLTREKLERYLAAAPATYRVTPLTP